MTTGYVARSLAAARAVVNGRGTGAPSLPVLPSAPVFSNLAVTQITPTSARISWDADQACTGLINYGLTAGYGSSSSTSSSAVSHALTITGLTANTLYHYRIRGTNGAAQETVGTDGTFTTATDAAPSGDYDQWVDDLMAVFSGITYVDYNAADHPGGIPHAAGGVISSTATFKAWLNSVPNGSGTVWSRATVPSGWDLYFTTSETGIQFLAGRNRIKLVLDGVTVRNRTDGTSNFGNTVFMQGCDRIWVKATGATITGMSTLTGTSEAHTQADEQRGGVALRVGCTNIKFEDFYHDDTDGFGAFISRDGNTSSSAWPENVWFENCSFIGGVMGYGVVCARKLFIRGGLLKDTNWFPFDFEPDLAGEGYQQVWIEDVDIDKYGWEKLSATGGHTHWLLAMNPGLSDAGMADANAIVMEDLTFKNNTVLNGHVDGSTGGLAMRFNKRNVKKRTVITGNVSMSTRTSSGACIFGNAMDTLTVTGNTQRTVGGTALYQHDADATNVADISVTATPNTTS